VKALAVNPSEKSIGVVEIDEPEVSSPSDVKIKMLEVGICGTDKEIGEFLYGTPPRDAERLVIGHEGLGEVVEVGSAVSRVKPGDLVVPMVRRECSHDACDPCRAFRQDYCETGDYVERGIKEMNGFLTELVIDDERYLNVVPANLRDVGVLAEPLTIAEKALDQVWAVQRRLPWPSPDELRASAAGSLTAVVLGAGPVGLLGAMLLANAGFKVVVYSRAEKPNPEAALVEELGGTYISSTTHSTDEMAEIVGQIDVVYEGTGASGFAFDVLRALGTNGVYVFTGVPGGSKKIELDTAHLMKEIVLKNQVLVGTVNAGRSDYESAISHIGDFAARWPQTLRNVITGRYPLEAHGELLEDKVGGIKNVITLV
jgi:threonine dehydrogenase-like Zn-dependent dehydrogenase